MLDKLADMGAKNVNEMLMRDRGEKKQGYGNDKIRYTFSFDNRDQAMVCYNYFMNRQHSKKHDPRENPDDDLKITESIMIYLQKDEEIFIKYGDEEAKLYFEMEEMKKMEK